MRHLHRLERNASSSNTICIVNSRSVKGLEFWLLTPRMLHCLSLCCTARSSLKNSDLCNQEQAAVQPFVSNHRRQSGRNEYQLQQLTDLAIIHCCVSHFTTRFPGDAENVEMAWAKAIYKYWSFEDGDAVHLARLLQNLHWVYESQIRRNPASTSRDMCLGILAGEIQFAQALANPLLDRSTSGHYDTGSNLCTAFLRCVERCWSSLDEFLQTHLSETTIRSVRDLSDAVLGVVYGDPALEELRPKLRAVVDGLDDWFGDNMNSHTSGSRTANSSAGEALWPKFEKCFWYV
ncbi:hypothetical protein GQ600_22480 [Phytophthora cactorum]|nr:hypothetical protein GQ600_22480 [Phytophthora cactorum]